MRCVAPLVAWHRADRRGVTLRFSEADKRFPLSLPCGSCVNCLLERSRQHAVRCVHESRVSERNCFVTLTYDDKHLPWASSLHEPDVQRFLKSLREAYPNETIRYFYCGEYGERFGRPHYHLLLFGFDFEDKVVSGRRNGEIVWSSRKLELLWKRGRCEIGSVSYASAGYVARYVMKKQVVRDAVHELRDPEYVRMSLKNGAIGVPWLERWHTEVYPRDEIILEGAGSRPPRRYDMWLQKADPVAFNKLKAQRMEKRREDSLAEFGWYDYRFPDVADPDARSSRLRVIEEVMLAKVNLFAREFDDA